MKVSNNTKKLFVKDFSLPITIFEENYFEYYLKKIDPYFNSIEKMNLLLKSISNYENENQLFEDSKKIRLKIIDTIKNNENFLKFNNEKISGEKIILPEKNNLYKKRNCGKRFLSIDLVKANFQALKYKDPNIVLNASSYEEFMSFFEANDYQIKSKQIRQIIFGNLNPKRQQHYQKKIMSELYKYLLSHIKEEDIFASSSDEIVIEIKNNNSKLIEVLQNREILKEIDFHLDIFDLDLVHEDYDFMIKKYVNSNKIDIKNTPKKNIFEVISYLEKSDVSHLDLCFNDEGRIAVYDKPLF